MVAHLLREPRFECIEDELTHGSGMGRIRTHGVVLDQERGPLACGVQGRMTGDRVSRQVELDRLRQGRPRPIPGRASKPLLPTDGVHGGLDPRIAGGLDMLGLKRAKVARAFDDALWSAHGEHDAQVRVECVECKVRRLHGQARVRGDPAGEPSPERARAVGQVSGRLARHVGRRDAPRADPLGQCADQGLDELIVQSGHKPVIGIRIDDAQQGQRQPGLDAIARGARIVVVAQRHLQAMIVERVRILTGFLCAIGIGEQVAFGHPERGGVTLVAQPGSETGPRMDLGRQSRVIEREFGIAAGHEVVPSLALLPGEQSLAKSDVARDGRAAPGQFTVDQRTLDEHLSSTCRVDRAERDAATRDQREFTHGRAFPRRDLACLDTPVRLAHRVLDHVGCNLLDPLRADA